MQTFTPIDDELRKIIDNKELRSNLVQILHVLDKGPIAIPEDLFAILDDNRLYDFDAVKLTPRGKQFIAEFSNLQSNETH